jgi:PAS domain S-box-containing protein
MLDLLSEYFSVRVLLIGADGTIVSSLGRPRGMLGFGADERVGMHVAERVHPDDLPAVLDLLARARHAEGIEETVQVRARHKDGS